MADNNNTLDMNNMAEGNNNNLGNTEKDLHKIKFTSKLSFYSFIAVAILSFVESLKCNDNKVRHCLNLITVATVIMIIQGLTFNISFMDGEILKVFSVLISPNRQINVERLAVLTNLLQKFFV